MLGVNSDEDLEAIRDQVKTKNINWRSFWDGNDLENSIAKQWAVATLPESFLIDAKGIIRAKNIRGKPLDEAIERLVAETGATVELSGVDHEKNGAPK